MDYFKYKIKLDSYKILNFSTIKLKFLYIKEYKKNNLLYIIIE